MSAVHKHLKRQGAVLTALPSHAIVQMYHPVINQRSGYRSPKTYK